MDARCGTTRSRAQAAGAAATTPSCLLHTRPLPRATKAPLLRRPVLERRPAQIDPAGPGSSAACLDDAALSACPGAATTA